MRFAILLKADKDTEAGKMPSEELLAKMGQFNQELIDAGIMLAGEGLQPSSKGARVTFSPGKADVTDGPFDDTRALIAGFWIWKMQIEGRGDRVGQAGADADGQRRGGNRNPANFRSRGFRRGIYARTAGAGGAPAGATVAGVTNKALSPPSGGDDMRIVLGSQAV
jgi:hypothetical protein